MTASTVRAQVVFAYPERQRVLDVTLPAGATIEDAIHASGMLDRHPEIDLRAVRVGVHAQLRELHDVLRDGDRVEIYRPLKTDPKQARRDRAARERS